MLTFESLFLELFPTFKADVFPSRTSTLSEEKSRNLSSKRLLIQTTEGVPQKTIAHIELPDLQTHL